MGREQLLKAHRLLAISRTGVGYDSVSSSITLSHPTHPHLLHADRRSPSHLLSVKIDAPTAQSLGIPAMILPGMNAYTVAELTLTLALNLLRRIKEIDGRLSRGENVISMDVLGHSLKGRTLGLVGMGAIARAVADLFHVRLTPPPLVPSHPHRRALTAPSVFSCSTLSDAQSTSSPPPPLLTPGPPPAPKEPLLSLTPATRTSPPS